MTKMYSLKHHRNSLKNTNRRTVTETSLLESNSSTNTTTVTNNGNQTMLVKTCRTQLPKIEKASHVQIDSIQNIFGATTTSNLMGNGFNFHHHHEHNRLKNLLKINWNWNHRA